MVRLIESEYIDEGEGAKARRLLPNKGDHLDPFVIFDEYFISPDASFPMHPHGGFEGFQFLVEGATEYIDNMGNKGMIKEGEIRRFLAGAGFEHSEHPRSDITVRGYLIWMKLPENKKDQPSIFQELHGEDVEVDEDVDLRTTKVFGEGAVLETVTPAVFKHILFKRKTETEFDMASGWNGFLYVSRGSVTCCGIKVQGGRGIVLEPGNVCNVEGEEGTEMVMVRGRKLNEEIIQQGHFVR